MNFGDLLVAGVPLLLVVIGLVEWIKQTGINTKALPYVSMAIGLLFGAGYQISEFGLPIDFAGWFGVVVFGLGLGLVASGIYDAGKGILKQ
jgi:hypothetical protein